MKKITVSLGALTALLVPGVASAQNLTNLTSLVISLQTIVNIAIPLVFAIALLAFFWGLAKYIAAAGNEEKKAEGKNIMIWGVLALFIMASIWGIVIWIGNALGVGQGGSAPTPGVNTGDTDVTAPVIN